MSMTEHSGRHYPPPGYGAMLRRLRTCRRYGLRQAARAIGMSHGYLSLLEHGQRCPSRSMALAILDAYNVTDPDTRRAVLDVAVGDAGRDWTPPDPQRTGSAYGPF